ncbi:MAG: sugar ABC transporter permease [Spirochaetales bacterium]|nr:sugar ABC transporter permease [Spirochaetales bacterium]
MKSLTRAWKEHRVMYLFVTPSVILSISFFVIPFLHNLIISFCNWNIITNNGKFLGLENYIRIFTDKIFLSSILTTTQYTIFVVPFLLFFGLLFALIVNDSNLRGNSLFQMIYFIPWVIPWLTAGLIWRFLYNDLYGPLNYLLIHFRFIEKPILFLSTKMTAMASVILVCIWKTAGYNMVILLAGLKSIPEQVYEAAAIDGASGWKRFISITIPLIRSSIALMVIMAVVGSYLAFDHFWIVTRGAPSHETETILTWLYQTSFFRFRLGEGAAMSVVLLAITGIFAVIQVRAFNLLKLK